MEDKKEEKYSRVTEIRNLFFPYSQEKVDHSFGDYVSMVIVAIIGFISSFMISGAGLYATIMYSSLDIPQEYQSKLYMADIGFFPYVGTILSMLIFVAALGSLYRKDYILSFSIVLIMLAISYSVWGSDIYDVRIIESNVHTIQCSLDKGQEFPVLSRWGIVDSKGC